jgi:hypothetical protein
MNRALGIVITIGVLVLSTLTAPSGADNSTGYQASRAHPYNRDPGINTRQHNQRHRIAEGLHSGELTREENQALRNEYREIRQKEHTYKSDGKLTRAERRDLHREQNQTSQNIRKEKHDAEQRPETR